MKIVIATLLLAGALSLNARTLVVSLPPYRELAESLAGPGWEVIVALPAGNDHESYSPTPGQMRRLFEAEIYWATGMGFERLLLPKLQQSRKDLRLVHSEDVCFEAHHHHGGHGHHDHDDLHRWLNPALVIEDAKLFTAALIESDPANAEDYRARALQFVERCELLYGALKRELEPFAGAPIFVYHAAFGRFAEAFGIEQIALERDGREPSLRELTDLIEQARAVGASVVYVQPQHRRSSAEAVARALGGSVVEIDPMASDWAANLQRLARQFAKDLSAREARAE